MTIDNNPDSWRDPEYISTIVGVISAGTLAFYSVLVDTAPSIDTIIFVLLWVLIPVALAHEAARRWL